MQYTGLSPTNWTVNIECSQCYAQLVVGAVDLYLSAAEMPQHVFKYRCALCGSEHVFDEDSMPVSVRKSVVNRYYFNQRQGDARD